MKSETHIRIPWPPSVNAYWTPVGIGRGQVRMMLSPRARLYRNDVRCQILKQLGSKPLSPYEGPVRISIQLRAPDRRTRDIDNHIKGIFDAMTHCGVWVDDSQVDELTVLRGQLFKGGCAILQISSLGGESC